MADQLKLEDDYIIEGSKIIMAWVNIDNFYTDSGILKECGYHKHVSWLWPVVRKCRQTCTDKPSLAGLLFPQWMRIAQALYAVDEVALFVATVEFIKALNGTSPDSEAK